MDPSLHKAAVLVALLDDDTADLLLAQMTEEQADAVRGEVLRLGQIDPVEQQAIIDEFFRTGPIPMEAEPNGVELDGELLRRLTKSNAETCSEVRRDSIDRPASQTPFQFLHDAEPEELVPLLEREHPQAIALVLAHLPHERAGHVLARLPASIQSEVIRRLIDLEETDPQVLRDVERAVEAWLLRRQPARRRVAGMAAVSAILNASQGTARRQILNNLTVHDRPLAHKLTPPPPPPKKFTFDEVCDFPVESLAQVLRAADRCTVVLALAAAPPAVVQSIVEELPPKEAHWISHGINHLGPLRLADFDRAQNDIAELASQLHAQGQLPQLDTQHITTMV